MFATGVRPSAVAAARWPFGSASMPEATCTATRADMKNPMPMTAVRNGASGSCFSQTPQAAGSRSGTTKYHRNNWTSSGMLRNNSIQALARNGAVRPGSVRDMPTREPTVKARTQARAAVSNVVSRPWTSMSR